VSSAVGAHPATGPADPKTRAGELRIATGDDLAVSADPTRKAYEVIVWGMGETLARLARDGKLVPWLSQSIVNVDPFTWRVSLRPNARFWDSSPVTAQAVAESFRTNWEIQPDVDSLISRQTRLHVLDEWTLEFQTPQPTGNFRNALAYHQFVVYKDGGKTLTGPYRPVAQDANGRLCLEPFKEHWAGTPRIGRIEITDTPDLRARAKALQAGDVDMVYGLTPELLLELGEQYEIVSIPSKKLHFIQFNHTRPPFDDRDVREAMSLAIDRHALLKDVMLGHGAAAYGMFPPYGGVEAVTIQRTDVQRAQQLLDLAGWLIGSDGVRRKGDARLAFTLYSFPQRREMTALAGAIARQLRPLGVEAVVQEVPNIVTQTTDGNFLAAMRSINSLVTGDPYFLLRAMLGKGGRTNTGDYSSPPVEELLDELQVETEPARRQALSQSIQTIQATDVPNVFLLFTPIIMAMRKGKLRGFVPDPNNEYLIDGAFGVSTRRPRSAAHALTEPSPGEPFLAEP
jgi:peptide/nickel transport system substrate-binding protein